MDRKGLSDVTLEPSPTGMRGRCQVRSGTARRDRPRLGGAPLHPPPDMPATLAPPVPPPSPASSHQKKVLVPSS